VTDLRDVAWQLYGLAPDEFTAARTSAEREARAAGDRALAGDIKALRRPSLAAWAVNRLVRDRAELVEQVVALGGSLRQAQSLLQGDALRDLARQRRQLIAAVVSETRSLAAQSGQRLSEPAARQVEETLQAAMADPAAAEAVLSGLLVQPLSGTGVESLSAAAVEPVPSPRPGLSVVEDQEKGADRARREAEERIEEAGRALRAAAAELDEAKRRRAKAQAKVLQVEAKAEEVRRRLAELDARAERASERVEECDVEVAEAEAAVEEARAAAAAAARAAPR
jgi:hypothetical protein